MAGDPDSGGFGAAALAVAVFIAVASVLALALAPTPAVADEPGDAAMGPGEAEAAHDEHGMGTVGDANGSPARHTGPQGKVGQFVAKCLYSHSAPDDPIVHFEAPGRSHLHDFYGAGSTDASSTAEDLLADDTTCDKPADKAAYWQPALNDGDESVEPVQAVAYYRAAPGIDPTTVEPFPFGMEMIAGDAFATEPTGSEAAGWVCGVSTHLTPEPPVCPQSAPLHMLLTFPDCWDGERIRSADHQAHVAYSADGECPATHPVSVPQLTVSIKYPIWGPGHDLWLASGNVYSAHGDFFNAWEPEGLEREIDGCIHRDVVCDLASNREEEGPFFAE